MAAYEYSIVVQDITIKPGIGDSTGSEVSEDLSRALMKPLQAVNKTVDTYQGGGWEIVSHQLTRLDRHLALSFLIRRGK